MGDASRERQQQSRLVEYLTNEVMSVHGLTQAQLAARLDVSRQTIHDIVTEKRPVSAVMAMRLAEEFGRPPQFWLDLQKGNLTDVAGGSLTPAQDEVRRELRRYGTHTLVDFEITRACKSGMLICENFEENNVEPASYDIRVGTGWIYNPGEPPFSLCREHQEAVMRPGAMALVQSMEKFYFPTCFLGKLGQTTTLTRRCVVIAHGFRIDPGYRGFIYTTLRNVGRSDFALRRGNIFISLEIELLAVEPSRPYSGECQDRDFFFEEEQRSLDGGQRGDVVEAREALQKLSKYLERTPDS